MYLLHMLLAFLSILPAAVTEGRIKRQEIMFDTMDREPDGCTTPNGLKGSCILLKDCKALNVKKKASKSALHFSNFLRKSVCRFDYKIPFVCCPDTKITKTVAIMPNHQMFRGQSTAAPAANLFSQACGTVGKIHTRIAGGKKADKGSWPWIAALGYKENARANVEFLCAGTLITDRHILTAAHCANTPSLATVRLGEHDMRVDNDTSHEDYAITKKVIHDGYDRASVENDISILTLNKKVVFKEHIKPICLPRGKYLENKTLEGVQAVIAGWGDIAYDNESSPVLKEAMLVILSNSECRQKYAVFPSLNIDKRRICAGLGGNDACQGDSGGPLVVWDAILAHYSIVGIVASGFKCGDAKFPGMYVRVTEYLDWIERNI